MIADHETNPESHLGTGESLETHRAQDVLDHPQGSVVADKRQFSQLEFATSFESIDAWTVTAASSFHELGAFGLTTTATTGNIAFAWLEDGLPILAEQLVKSPMFQIAFELLSVTNVTHNFLFTLDQTMIGWPGIGFRITNADIVGLFHDGATLHSVSLGNVATYTTYIARAFVNIALNRVEFWLNGVLLGTVPFEQHYTSDEALFPYFSVTKTGGTTAKTVFIRNMVVARDF
jgi:hypothetical protein